MLPTATSPVDGPSGEHYHPPTSTVRRHRFHGDAGAGRVRSVREGECALRPRSPQSCGKGAARFEGAYRNGWMPTWPKGATPGCSGISISPTAAGSPIGSVTVTAVRDGAAWARLAERVARGDLQRGRGTSTGSNTSPWAGSWPRSSGRHPSGHWRRYPPSRRARADDVYGGHDVAVPRQGPRVHPGRRRRVPTALGAEGSQMQMHIELAIQAMPGAGRIPEVTLMQRLSSLPPLIRLLTTRHPRRGDRARVVDARGPRAPGPVAEQAVAHRGVVPAASDVVVTVRHDPHRRSGGAADRCCSCTRPTR